MKAIKASSMKDFEYRAERSQEKKQTKQLRNERRNRKSMWSNAE